ncbi:hypothetical protein ACHAXH_005437, partial [Discostella pseudostelligera]
HHGRHHTPTHIALWYGIIEIALYALALCLWPGCGDHNMTPISTTTDDAIDVCLAPLSQPSSPPQSMSNSESMHDIFTDTDANTHANTNADEGQEQEGSDIQYCKSVQVK